MGALATPTPLAIRAAHVAQRGDDMFHVLVHYLGLSDSVGAGAGVQKGGTAPTVGAGRLHSRLWWPCASRAILCRHDVALTRGPGPGPGGAAFESPADALSLVYRVEAG